METRLTHDGDIEHHGVANLERETEGERLRRGCTSSGKAHHVRLLEVWVAVAGVRAALPGLEPVGHLERCRGEGELDSAGGEVEVGDGKGRQRGWSVVGWGGSGDGETHEEPTQVERDEHLMTRVVAVVAKQVGTAVTISPTIPLFARDRREELPLFGQGGEVGPDRLLVGRIGVGRHRPSADIGTAPVVREGVGADTARDVAQDWLELRHGFTDPIIPQRGAGYNSTVKKLLLRIVIKYVANLARRIARTELPETCYDCVDDLIDLVVKYWRDYA